MTIAIHEKAQELNKLDWESRHFMMLSLGLLSPIEEPGTITVLSSSVEYSRTISDNISYGNTIEINAENLDQLGLGDDIITYAMDDNGNLDLTDLSDTHENNPEGFLLNMDGDVNSWMYNSQQDEYTITGISNDEAPAFMIQPVTVDGMLQGYFVYGKDSFGEQSGLYLDASAVDLSGMDPDMKATLFADPPAVSQENTLSADNNLAITEENKIMTINP